MKTGKIMRKLSFQFNRGLLMLLVICGVLTACSNDDWKEDVNELKKPVPSGVVLLDDAAVRVVKGNQFRITFRMNPSGTTLNREDVELDVRNSDTYFCTEQAPTGTRASYVTSSDYYELLQIEADKNEAGEILDGQWVATIQTKGEANFRNVADLLLVVNYTDAAGGNCTYGGRRSITGLLWSAKLSRCERSGESLYLVCRYQSIQECRRG